MKTNLFLSHHGWALRLGRPLAAAALLATTALSADELAPPFRVEASGKPIDVDIGHAAPLLADLDGDGVRDLLVGQFGDGKLRFYRNTGNNTAPKFAALEWVKAGGADAKVPSG
jgi:hypothetical protein